MQISSFNHFGCNQCSNSPSFKAVIIDPSVKKLGKEVCKSIEPVRDRLEKMSGGADLHISASGTEKHDGVLHIGTNPTNVESLSQERDEIYPCGVVEAANRVIKNHPKN